MYILLSWELGGLPRVILQAFSYNGIQPLKKKVFFFFSHTLRPKSSFPSHWHSNLTTLKFVFSHDSKSIGEASVPFCFQWLFLCLWSSIFSHSTQITCPSHTIQAHRMFTHGLFKLSHLLNNLGSSRLSDLYVTFG